MAVHFHGYLVLTIPCVEREINAVVPDRHLRGKYRGIGNGDEAILVVGCVSEEKCLLKRRLALAVHLAEALKVRDMRRAKGTCDVYLAFLNRTFRVLRQF